MKVAMTCTRLTAYINSLEKNLKTDAAAPIFFLKIYIWTC